MADCIFCKIVAGDSPATVVAETENVIAFKSIDPAAKAHILIVPKKHISSFTDLSKDDKNLFFEMAETAQRLVFQNDAEGGYKLIFNGGKYQAINHLHWHLLAGNLQEDKT